MDKRSNDFSHTHIVPASSLKGLADEARQLSAIMTASARTRRSNLNIT